MTTPRYRTDLAGRAGSRAGLAPLEPPVDLTPTEAAAFNAADARGDKAEIGRIIAAARARAQKDCGCSHGDAATPQAIGGGLPDEETARQNMYRNSRRTFDSNGGRRRDGRPAPREDGPPNEERLRLDMERDSRARWQRGR